MSFSTQYPVWSILSIVDEGGDVIIFSYPGFIIFSNNDKGKTADIQKTTGKSLTCFNVTPNTMEFSPLVIDHTERPSGTPRNRARRGGARSSSYSSRGGNTGSYSGNRDGNRDRRSYSGNRDGERKSYSRNRESRRPSGLRKTIRARNSLAHKTIWLHLHLQLKV